MPGGESKMLHRCSVGIPDPRLAHFGPLRY